MFVGQPREQGKLILVYDFHGDGVESVAGFPAPADQYFVRMDSLAVQRGAVPGLAASDLRVSKLDPFRITFSAGGDRETPQIPVVVGAVVILFRGLLHCSGFLGWLVLGE